MDDQALAQTVHHLRDGNRIVVQLEFGNFSCAVRAPAGRRFDQVDQRDDQFALGFVGAVERLVRVRPDVIFDLLLLIEQLRGVLEFFVLEQAMHQVVARILGLLLGDRSGSAGSSIFDLM